MFSSMAQALPMVKRMINDLVKEAKKIPTWILTSFKGPAIKLIRKTRKVKVLEKAVDALEFSGDPKDDDQEQALKGNTSLLFAVQCPIWRRACLRSITG